MRVNDLRQLSDKDLRSRLNDNKESLQKYRFQKSIQQLEDYKILSDLTSIFDHLFSILT